MLNRIREALTPLMDRVGSTFAKTGITPTGWSFVALLFAALAGSAYAGLWGGWVWGGVLLLVSGFFDIVDGSVARVTGSVSRRGAFVDSNFDRIAEIMVYGGIMVGRIGEPTVVLAALAVSMLVSYARARGESLNVKLSGVGVGERAERIFILALASIVGYPYYGVILVLAVASITFIHRLIYTTRELGREQ
ncbi:MAG: CDP-alcohol phosphatidyltransferase family protein [Nitrososphaerales archaeon]